MKFNWGHGITLLTIGFVSFMTFLVAEAIRQNFDLVTEDYYGKELKFQDQIERQKNQQELKETIVCTVDDKLIVLTFPSDFKGKDIQGEVHFFRPSDATKDVKIKIGPGKDLILTADRAQFTKGLYKIKLDYRVENKEYYYEDEIMIR